MYFAALPRIVYTLDGGDTGLLVTDIFRRFTISEENLTTSTSFDEYDILDGDTPEITAHRLYNNAELHWILLVVNNIIDPRYDWPLSTMSLNNYVTKKYGIGNEYNIHHYVNNDGDIVHSSYAAGPKISISNYEYEESVNEQKRRIKVLRPQFIESFLKIFDRAVKNG
jgi:hypothetical protein